MGRRPDPWLPGAVLLVHADEVHALWPLIQRGLAEWSRMGVTGRLEQVGDVLARWQHLAELHDQQLRGSAGGTVTSDAADDRAVFRGDGPLSTGAAAELLGCSSRWVRRLAARGDLTAVRGAGGCWAVDAASVEAYVRRRDDAA